MSSLGTLLTASHSDVSPQPQAHTSDISIKNSMIMVVDDESLNIRVVQKYLTDAGYHRFVTTDESAKALGMMVVERPDLVILDLMMPHVNGMEILEAKQQMPDLRHTPTLILTASDDKKMKISALERGVTDFLSKPVDSSELAVRVRNALVAKAHQTQLANYSAQLRHQVRIQTFELEESRKQVIRILACAAEHRDEDTGHHVDRVGQHAAIIADELGLDRKQVELIEQAAVLHDVGKIAIPDSILLKPGKLEPEEFEFMKQHCELGRRILYSEPGRGSHATRLHSNPEAMAMSPVLEMAAIIAMSHHEKWDGSGYPRGLSGEEIPLVGRITAVADVFDALCSERPYKPPFDVEKCCEILQEGRGTHFDPNVLDAFFARLDEVLAVQRNLADPA